MTGIPAGRYVERLAAARRVAGAAGLDALLVGVGPDLQYLAGYAALPAERLTLLVVPAADGAPLTLIAPRLEVTPARACPAAAAGALEIATWEETEDPMALVAARLEAATGMAAGAIGAVAVSDGLRAAFVLGLQRVLPGARFSVTSSVLRALRMRKDADEVALLRAAAHAADRVVAAVAERSARRPDRGGCRPRDPGAPRRRGPRAAPSSRSSPRGPTAPRRTTSPGERVIAGGEPIVIDIGGTLGGYGSDITRTVWVTGPGGSGPDAEFLRLYGVLQRCPGGRDCRRPARRPVRGDRRGRAAAHHGRGVRAAVLPPDRARDRPRGPRGAVPGRGQPRAARAGHGVQRGARDLPGGPVRSPDRGHRRVRRGGAVGPQRGDQGPPGRHRLTRGTARPPEVSSADRPRPPADARASNDDHPSRAGDRPALHGR